MRKAVMRSGRRTAFTTASVSSERLNRRAADQSTCAPLAWAAMFPTAIAMMTSASPPSRRSLIAGS
jgi:hypothetical protein